MYKVYLSSMSASLYALSTILYLFAVFALSSIAILLYVPSLCIQAPSPRHRCGSVILPPPAPSRFLATPRLGNLNRDTLLGMTTCEVTGTIWSRRSLTNSSLSPSTHHLSPPRH